MSKYVKIKSKSGFTLIELIVVIAILGILAAIAIPRFAGFTDKAKIGADTQYGNLIGNSVMTMLAAGDISFTAAGDATVTVDSTGVVTGTSNITYTKVTDLAGFNTALIKLVPVKVPQYYKTSIVITVNDSGVKSVVGTP